MPGRASRQHVIRNVGGRLGWFVISMLVASAVVFWITNVLPGDVAGTILGPQADPASIAALRRQLGLDRPVWQRYLTWMGGLLSGNPGMSALSGDPVLGLVGARLAVTGWLVGLGMALALLIALPLGALGAVRRSTWVGTTTEAISQVGMAIPAFLAGTILVIIFAVRLHWLPANGYIRLNENPGQWARHLVLPVLSLAMVQAAVLTRYVRSAFIDVLGEEYFRTARAVGWTYNRAILRHGLRNAGLQIMTVVGLQLVTLFVGAIVVESVFVLPGLGSLLLSAVNSRDLPVVQSVVMLLVALVLVINTVIDLCYQLIDPRLRTLDAEAEVPS